MQYLALLYAAESEVDDPTTAAFAEELERYRRFDEIAGDAVIGGAALQPSNDAVSVTYDDGGVATVTDGVFSEAQEVIGGLYVLEVDDLDHAIELARHIPAAEKGAVELRPAVEWSEDPRELPPHVQRYLLVLAGSEDEADRPGTASWDAAVAEHARFAERAGEAILGGAALQPSDAATVVQVRGGERLVIDGTFAEATEVIGGLYLVAAASQEDAVKLARDVPMGPGGIVWVRPVLTFG